MNQLFNLSVNPKKQKAVSERFVETMRKKQQSFKMPEFDLTDVKFPQLGPLTELEKHPLERYSCVNIIIKSLQSMLAPSKYYKVFSPKKRKKLTFDDESMIAPIFVPV